MVNSTTLLFLSLNPQHFPAHIRVVMLCFPQEVHTQVHKGLYYLGLQDVSCVWFHFSVHFCTHGLHVRTIY